jgi:hypothetical protein
MWRKLTITLVILILAACSGNDVTSKMNEVVGAFGNHEKLKSAIEKYAEPGVIPEALKLCDLGKPTITKTEQMGKQVVYTLEARVEKCEQSETAVGTIRIFKMGWENGKIVTFEWGGPKGGKVEY